jgi:hypothetical protein
MRKSRTRQHGITSMLAMLYLALFSTLAVGFYGAVTASVQLARNEGVIANAVLAADSGMSFMRYQLYQMNIPYGTAPDQLWNAVYDCLQGQLCGSGKPLGSNTIALNGSTIEIPSNPSDTVALDGNGNSFHVSITQSQSAQLLTVKVTGHMANSSVTRIVKLDYKVGSKASAIFDYGVASKGSIAMNGNTKIQGATNPAMGSVLSALLSSTPVTMTGSTLISGDISMVDPSGSVGYTGSPSIAGSTDPTVWANHVHSGVPQPDFPTVDTTVFEQYLNTAAAATTDIATSNPPLRNYTNIRIKAGANPSFQANTTITGVIYIETPNQVKIAGNANIQGVIVEQPNGTGSPATNSITFTGTSNAVTFNGVESLPNTAQFATLRTLTGAFVLAPDFALSLKGNFGTIGGSIVAGSMALTGNAGGTVNGTAIVMNGNAAFSGNSDMIINSQGTNQNPAGVFFGQHYTAQADSYDEPLQ